jgi:exopolyphosphatase/guanosine-5'-triphosphate,3'-diphosphate pyrophosphatase
MRAEHGLDLALHGNWVGIDGAERATLAMALFVANGGLAPDAETTTRLQRLAPAAALARARLWGLAIRLGQRLAGSSADLLGRARLGRDSRALVLSLQRDLGPLYGEAVRRRHRLLGQALALEPVLRLLTPGELQALAS